jgi:hypothetical protein
MSEKDTDYPTDEFGRPDGLNYHYRIPMNNRAAMSLATRALRGMYPFEDRFVTEWDGASGDGLTYFSIETHDNKGHLDGLEKYTHAPEWEDGFRMSCIDEYRRVTGGTKVRGSFRATPTEGYETTLHFETVVSLTKAKLEDAEEKRDERWREVQREISAAKDERIEEWHRQRVQQQRECDHEHTLLESHHPRAEGYCEDCGADVNKNNEVVY